MSIQDPWKKVVMGALIIFCLVVMFKLILPANEKKEAGIKEVKQPVQKEITDISLDTPREEKMVTSGNSKETTVDKHSINAEIEHKSKTSVGMTAEGPVRDLEWEKQRSSSLLMVVRLHYRRAKREPKYYKIMIEFARKIFKEFPDSEEAAQARELLRKIPGEYLKKYSVTDKELNVAGNI